HPKHPEALWRTFHATERPRQAEGRTGNIQLRLGLTDDEFAARGADTFFSRHASPLVPRPVKAMPDTTSITTTPFTLDELQDAIKSACRHSAPGHDGLPYEVYNNLEGEAAHCLHHPSQNGFRQHLGTEDDLDCLAKEVLHLSPYSHLVRTLVATDISRAYDNIALETASAQVLQEYEVLTTSPHP
ncbi:hypothetical protein HPB47_012345, partial [Ixodes persulcatus]